MISFRDGFDFREISYLDKLLYNFSNLYPRKIVGLETHRV